MDTDVVVSGGGPNGLFLAAELALAGAHPVVVEQLPVPTGEPKANGLVGQVVRMLDIRGLYHEFSGSPHPPRPMPAFMFGGIPLPLAELESNPLYGLAIPQPKLVNLLEKRALDLGVEVRRGHQLIDFVQQDDRVQATVRGPHAEYRITSSFLVGADGGRSLVRKRLGIAFPGSTSDSVSRFGHARLADSVSRGADGALKVPGIGRLRFGPNRLERGGFLFGELEPGRPLVGVVEYDGDAEPDQGPMSFAELQEAIRRVLGVELPVEPPTGPGPHALRRVVGQNTRLAERYRDGSVFLLGDAAHVHSAMGGPGLNLGLQDAMNLGWKLGAHLAGWAPADLLDTYHGERHPVGEQVMTSSLAQTGLMKPGPEVTALRQLFTELLQAPDVVHRIAELMAGSSVRYDVGDPHPMSGRFLPDFTIEADGTRRRVAGLLHSGRPVLLDLTDAAVFRNAARHWHTRVDLLAAHALDAPAAALLIRPDGCVAWAADEPGPSEHERLTRALCRWFGPNPSRLSPR